MGEEKKKFEKATGFIAEFKKFIARGNVLDMAVGIIVGSAFTAIVTSLVKDIITPLVGTVLAGTNFSKWVIKIPFGSNPEIMVGNFIQAIFNFIVIAFCVFMIVKFINKLTKKNEAPKEPPKPSEDVLLLKEIRDLLKEQKENK